MAAFFFPPEVFVLTGIEPLRRLAKEHGGECVVKRRLLLFPSSVTLTIPDEHASVFKRDLESLQEEAAYMHAIR